MEDILSSKTLDEEEKVLERYLTYYDQRKGQPFHVKLTVPKPEDTPNQKRARNLQGEIYPNSSRTRSHQKCTLNLQDWS